MRILFIVNPTAGRGTAAKKLPKLEKLLESKGVDHQLLQTTGPGDAQQFAQERRNDFDLVTVFGGDGTMNEVLNGLVDGSTPMAVMPIGTGNDFVRSARLPMKLEPALDNLLNGKPRICDLGIFNGERHFIKKLRWMTMRSMITLTSPVSPTAGRWGEG